MRTIKLVIIGDSGVGKTSVRGQYISGQFSTGYKATIGTDFISKSLPHYKNPEESVTLQIWDTAGQERFSSLSSAFFRGADAVILMFDVNKPETLNGLTKWWNSFKERAPVPDEEAEDYCCIVVGNKIDLIEANGSAKVNGRGVEVKERVSEAQAEEFIEELIPRKTATATSPDDEPDSEVSSTTTEDNGQLNGHADPLRSDSPPKSESIQIQRSDSSSSHPYAKPDSPRGDATQSRKRVSSSRSDDRLLHIVGGGGMAAGGTMTTINTIYHTPASSLFESESFASAQSSPFASSESSVDTAHQDHSLDAAAEASTSLSANTSPTAGSLLHARRMTSASSSSSAPTITPSVYQRAQASTSAAAIQPSPSITASSSAVELPILSSGPSPPPSSNTAPTEVPPPHIHHQRHPPHPERRPKLFFTSAKTGVGIVPVFEYVAKRVVMRWEYEEALEARRMHVREATEAIRLAEENRRGRMGRFVRRVGCCGM